MICLSDFDLSSLESHLAQCGFLPSHAHRLLRAYYQRFGTFNPEDLNVGKALACALREGISLRQSRVIARHCSSDGTIKLLVQFDRGGVVETILIPAYRPDRAAGCVSSQIGCAMGCDFCASTRNGLLRNLTSGEIVEQFLHLKRESESQHRRLRT